MARIKQNKIIFVDLELTCWDDEPPLGQSSEIIRIAAVEVFTDRPDYKGRCIDLMVKPVKSQISEYCTDLTGITPEDVKRARPFSEICASLRRDFGSNSTTWAAWGDDRTVMELRCQQDGHAMPFGGPYVDVGTLWGLMTSVSKPTSLLNALGMAGMEFEGIPHRPLDDAWNAARLFMFTSSTLKNSLTAVNSHIDHVNLSNPVFK